MQKKSSEKTENGMRKDETSTHGVSESSQLMKLFEDELKDIYWAEKALTKAIPKLIKNSTSEELKTALENHLGETEGQVTRVEQIFKLLGKRAISVKCEAMNGLIKESDDIIDECEEGPVRDAGIISAAQKVEHYEIASYGTLKAFAKTLNLPDVIELLDDTLNEEKAADKKLTEISTSVVNEQALHEEMER